MAKSIKLPLLTFAFHLSLLFALSSCGSRKDQLEVVSSESATDESSISLYAQVDSVFKVNNEEFAVNVKQYDNTEAAMAAGDTLSRPTYSVTIRIVNNGNVIFKDSVLRDSWGYQGKIVSIDSYELAFPMMSLENNQIQFLFKVYEQTDGDAIDGLINFDLISKKASYTWRESISED